MNRYVDPPAELITDELIDEFHANGAVCVPNEISPDWIDQLRTGMAKNLDAPGPRARLWDRDAEGNTSRYDSQMWQNIPEYRRFITESPMAEIAGRILRSSTINFFFDAIFVRSPGNRFRTPFHQDEPYWSVTGYDTCSAWLPLVPVEKRSALEFVKGSHLWEGRLHQPNFGGLTGDDRDQVDYGTDSEPFPDIEGERHRYDILSWEMEPGDVAIFNARTIHGGSGNLAPDRDLQVFNTKWVGDDVRVIFRPEGMDPDHQETMTAVGLAPGDRLGTDLYPKVWSAKSG